MVSVAADRVILPGESCHRQDHVCRAAFQCLRCTTPLKGSSVHGSDLVINNIKSCQIVVPGTSSIDEIDPVVGCCVSPASGRLSQIALLDHLLNREMGGDLIGAHGGWGSSWAANHIVFPTVLLCLGADKC